MENTKKVEKQKFRINIQKLLLFAFLFMKLTGIVKLSWTAVFTPIWLDLMLGASKSIVEVMGLHKTLDEKILQKVVFALKFVIVTILGLFMYYEYDSIKVETGEPLTFILTLVLFMIYSTFKLITVNNGRMEISSQYKSSNGLTNILMLIPFIIVMMKISGVLPITWDAALLYVWLPALLIVLFVKFMQYRIAIKALRRFLHDNKDEFEKRKQMERVNKSRVKSIQMEAKKKSKDGKLRIGYRGIEGSNSEVAAQMMSKRLNVGNVELIPLVSSKKVVEELKEHRIDYGVLAVMNTLGGIVKETSEVLKDEQFITVFMEILPIEHSLFKKNEIKIEDIDTIASHEQALKQTINNRQKLFPNCKEVEVEDTAIAAKYLADGVLEDNTAVLCRKNTGEMYGLDMVNENLSDNAKNFTRFIMLK